MELQQALEVLLNGNQKAAEVKHALDEVESSAKREGLSPSHISQLLHLVVNREDSGKIINSAIRNKIIHSLVPASTVPVCTILTAMASLPAATASTQLLLLKWVVLVFDYVDDITPLKAVYNVFFYYLQHDDLRPLACQLLCYLTDRSHVTKWRVQCLLQVQKKVTVHSKGEPPLTALLLVYKQLRPDLVHSSISVKRKTWFKTTESSMYSCIRAVQEKNSRQANQTPHSRLFGLQLAPPPTKMFKTGDLPPSLPLPHPHSPFLAKDTISISHLTVLPDLLAHIDHVQLPQQIASVLESHIMQHYFSICPAISAMLRLVYWLTHVLDCEFEQMAQGIFSEKTRVLLRSLISLRDFLMEPLPVVEQFLELVLENWTGDQYREEVLQLVSHLSLQPFDNLHHCILVPIKKLMLKKDVVFKGQCLDVLSALLRNFASVEWRRCHARPSTSERERLGESYT